MESDSEDRRRRLDSSPRERSPPRRDFRSPSPRREPRDIPNLTAPRVYIGNLAYSTDWRDLKDYLKRGTYLYRVITTNYFSRRSHQGRRIDGPRWPLQRVRLVPFITYILLISLAVELLNLLRLKMPREPSGISTTPIFKAALSFFARYEHE